MDSDAWMVALLGFLGASLGALLTPLWSWTADKRQDRLAAARWRRDAIVHRLDDLTTAVGEHDALVGPSLKETISAAAAGAGAEVPHDSAAAQRRLAERRINTALGMLELLVSPTTHDLAQQYAYESGNYQRSRLMEAIREEIGVTPSDLGAE